MAENAQAGTPFLKMFEDLNAPWCGAVKQVVAQCLDTGTDWTQKALELNEQMTAWAKETPLAPVFEAQRLLVQQVVENSAAFARVLWQIETKAAGKVA